jgi:hypothetical protein
MMLLLAAAEGSAPMPTLFTNLEKILPRIDALRKKSDATKQ